MCVYNKKPVVCYRLSPPTRRISPPLSPICWNTLFLSSVTVLPHAPLICYFRQVRGPAARAHFVDLNRKMFSFEMQQLITDCERWKQMPVLSFKIVLKCGVLISAVFLLCNPDSWIIFFFFFLNVTASARIFSDPKHKDDDTLMSDVW